MAIELKLEAGNEADGLKGCFMSAIHHWHQELLEARVYQVKVSFRSAISTQSRKSSLIFRSQVMVNKAVWRDLHKHKNAEMHARGMSASLT